MADLIERLRKLAQHEHDDLSIGAEAADEIENLRSELHAADALRERLTAILTATADALKGPPGPVVSAHSWHDLADVADDLRGRWAGAEARCCTLARTERENRELRARIDLAPVAIMDTRDALGICAPAEEDFHALYALQGKHVRLVAEVSDHG